MHTEIALKHACQALGLVCLLLATACATLAPEPPLAPTPDLPVLDAPLATATPDLTPAASPAAAAAERHNRARTLDQPIQRVWFYKPPADGNIDGLLNYFDVFVLSSRDDLVRNEIKQRGVVAPVLMYLSFDSVQDPGSCTAKPRRNQVAFQPGDFCQLSKEHPDWFLRDAQGNLIHEDTFDSDVLMDPAKPAWREFWLNRARQLVEEGNWDGVMIDNVEASLGKRQRLKILPAAYPDDARYQAAVEGFLNYSYTNYFRPRGKLMYANIIDIKDNAVWFRLLQNLDGVMIEAFAVDWHDGYFETGEWEANLHDIETAQARGKRIMLVAQGNRDDAPRQQFAYASFLLIADGHTSFRYASAAAYDQAWVYPNYDIDLGKPLGRRYRVGPFWKRDFTNGSVTVDPQTHTGTITSH